MPQKKKPVRKSIINRRARFDYFIEEEFVVGIELTGAETKALRMGLGQLSGAYVSIKDSQLWLINAMISGTGSIRIGENEQSRSRRLLAKKREIGRMIEAKQQGRTLIPLEIMNHTRYIKLKLAIAKGKKRYDKRQTLKQRSDQRQIEASLKRRF